jgi:cell division protein FtsW
MPRKASSDRILFSTVVILSVFGILMVGSASYYIAMKFTGNPYHFLIRQLIFVIAGMLLLYGIMHFNYRNFRKTWLVVSSLIAVSLLLILALMGPEINGTRRWIDLGYFHIQPSEFAKLAIILFIAYQLEKKKDNVNDFLSTPIPCLSVVVFLSLLIAFEPDMGTALFLPLIAFIMFFIAGLKYKYVGYAAAGGVIAFATMVLIAPYRIIRILSFLGLRGDDPYGADYNIQQSLIAIGSGGIPGKSFTASLQKAYFLPEPHTDFIFSVIGEELGLIGAFLLLSAFLIILWRAIRTALKAQDRLGFYLGIGITSMIVLQAMINIGVALKLLPVTGMPIPFVSYGGSSLFASFIGVGILLNISKHSS